MCLVFFLREQLNINSDQLEEQEARSTSFLRAEKDVCGRGLGGGLGVPGQQEAGAAVSEAAASASSSSL